MYKAFIPQSDNLKEQTRQAKQLKTQLDDYIAEAKEIDEHSTDQIKKLRIECDEITRKIDGFEIESRKAEIAELRIRIASQRRLKSTKEKEKEILEMSLRSATMYNHQK